MTVFFDFDTDKASADWLTSILAKNGFLNNGKVSSVQQTASQLGQGSAASFYNLSLTYSDDSSGPCPTHMLLKVAKPGASQGFENIIETFAAYHMIAQNQRDELLHKEPLFYEAARGSASPLPFMTCYGSDIDREGRQNCLLLEDLSDRYQEPFFPLPPSEEVCNRTVQALAKIHAYWWNDDRFGSDTSFPQISDTLIDDAVGIYGKTLDTFKGNAGDGLSVTRRDLLDRVITILPRLLKTRFSGADVTLIHGDAHHWNVLSHKKTSETIIYDWQTWHVDYGAHDLAYMMAIGWFRERRQRFEHSMLKRYHETLTAAGIDFTLDQLLADYRLSITRHLLTPILLSNLVHPAVWWPQIDRVFTAFEDWECDELLC